MKYIQLIFLFVTYTIIVSCNDKQPNQITNVEDYQSYLRSNINPDIKKIKTELSFWKQKIENTPNQYPYYSKIASLNTKLFKLNGNISMLKNAERNLIIANQKTNYNNASYLRGLARNYISQHRFKEALALLIKAENNGEKLYNTHLMLVDVYLELGNKEIAEKYLAKIINTKSFDYLIRLSKYNDQIGDLDSAINCLEQALLIAKSTKNKSLMQWNYTNLADYYGHAGRIKDSYNAYLHALELNPNNSYAKKGIAWIVYSYERNPIEALRILNVVSKENSSPDYFLLKSEIADFMGKTKEKESELIKYYNALESFDYGTMYAKYNVLLYAEDVDSKFKAIEIAKQEVKERPTAQSYDLLAWSYFKNGELIKAKNIINNYVVNNTFEPEALYHMAQIFKANKSFDKIPDLKEELIGAIYELGPNAEEEILNL